MLIGGLIGGISGGVFAEVSGAVAPWLSNVTLAGQMGPPTAGMMLTGQIGGAMVGGATAGATAGGLRAAFYGGDIGDAMLTGAGLGAATAVGYELMDLAADKMREIMIEQSKLDPRNSSGISAGHKGDGFKLGGGRYDAADPEAIAVFGGRQGGPGFMFGRRYAPGSWQDSLIEAYAGPHDFFNSPFLYDAIGNTRQNMTAIGRGFGEVMAGTNLVVATPFAIAGSVPATYFNALSVSYFEAEKMRAE